MKREYVVLVKVNGGKKMGGFETKIVVPKWMKDKTEEGITPASLATQAREKLKKDYPNFDIPWLVFADNGKSQKNASIEIVGVANWADQSKEALDDEAPQIRDINPATNFDIAKQKQLQFPI